jgi:glyoxylase-like metal-dependent hydrolase (beta-lactamase superfamily II)
MKINDKLFAYPWRDYRANNGNAYVIRSGDAVCLIDPGLEAFLPQLYKSMEEEGVPSGDVNSVILTHGHPDHMEGGLTLGKQGIRVGIHKDEEAYIVEMGPYLARMLGIDMPEVSFDFYLEEGEPAIHPVRSVSSGKSRRSCSVGTSSSPREWGGRISRVATETC